MENRPGDERLPNWDQVAMRVYFQVAMCFPFDSSCSRDSTVQHLASSLDRLVKQWPQLGGNLFLGEGADASHVFLGKGSGKIPLEWFDLATDSTDTSYENVKQKNFPPECFVRPEFGLHGQLHRLSSNHEVLPAVRVRLFFVPGGLFLLIHLHHSLGDGHCLGMLIDALAAQTYGDTNMRPRRTQIEFPPWRRGDRKLDELFQACPEYSLLLAPRGPTVPAFGLGPTPELTMSKIGKTFVFLASRLKKLRSWTHAHFEKECPHAPSIYTCLAALTWVFVTHARLKAENLVSEHEKLQKGKILMPIDWSRRCFSEVAKDYFGNTAATLAVETPVQELMKAYDDKQTYARIVQKITTAIHSVDQSWVEHRNALFERISDPRLLGLSHDPRRPQELPFNTWRHYGSDARWKVPGVPAERPDAIRRGQSQWSMVGALILPARAGSSAYELLVSLPACSMAELQTDSQWLGWGR